jgi:hypothetical protein
MKNELTRISYYNHKAMKNFYKNFRSKSDKKVISLNKNNYLNVSEMNSIRGGITTGPALPPIIK